MTHRMELSRRLVLGAAVAAGLLRRAGAEDGASTVPALPVAPDGRRFVILGDSTSLKRGIQLNHFNEVGAAVRKLSVKPEFLFVLGDHFWGNGWDEQTLRDQWQEWFEAAKVYGDLPSLHLTGNHTCFDETSARVFRGAIAPHLPAGTEMHPNGMGFAWRDRDLLMIAANDIFGRNATESRVDWRWIDMVLSRHADAPHKFVASHYPAFPVNGYRQPCWHVAQQDVGPLWKVLVKHRVSAYLCAHVIAFDVQVHQGIPHVCSAGAGFANLYPPQTEYFHAVELAIDGKGLSWQTLDGQVAVREQGRWPFPCPPVADWPLIEARGAGVQQLRSPANAPAGSDILLVHVEGKRAPLVDADQTLFTGWNDSSAPVAVWIGLRGGHLEVRAVPKRGDTQLLWRGPRASGKAFAFDVALHTGLGPSGVLVRANERAPWTSLRSDSAQGLAQMAWPDRWSVGFGHAGYNRLAGGEESMIETVDAFRGSSLQVRARLIRV